MNDQIEDLKLALALIDKYDDPELSVIGGRLAEFIRGYKADIENRESFERRRVAALPREEDREF